jgi:hypothetical protein
VKTAAPSPIIRLRVSIRRPPPLSRARLTGHSSLGARDRPAARSVHP